jgi:hypothetical protein
MPITLLLAPVSRLARPWALLWTGDTWLVKHSASFLGFDPISNISIGLRVVWHGRVFSLAWGMSA